MNARTRRRLRICDRPHRCGRCLGANLERPHKDAGDGTWMRFCPDCVAQTIALPPILERP